MTAALCAAAASTAPPISAQTIGTGVRVNLNALYDDNLLRGNELRPAPRSADFRLTPSFEIDVSRTVSRNRFFLKGDAGYDFHRRNTRLDAERIGLTAGTHLAFGARCAVDASARIDRRQTDIADLGIVQRNRLRGETYAIEAACHKIVGLFPIAAASHAAFSNSSASRDPFDLRTTVTTVGLAYARPSLGVVTVYYTQARISRPGMTTPTGEEDRTIVRQVGVRIVRAVANRLRGSIGVSAIDGDPSLPTTADFTGIGWQAELSWLPSPATTVTIESIRELRGESSFGVSYLVATTYALRAVHRLSHRTTIEAGAARVDRDLRGEIPFLGLPLRGDDRTIELGATLRYDLTPRLGLAFDLRHARRDADNRFYDYRSNRVGVRVGYRF